MPAECSSQLPKRVVITGHSKGIGAALVHTCLTAGWQVLGVARTSLVNISTDDYPAFRQTSVDLSNGDALRQWLSSGELNSFVNGAERVVLINNAGTVDPMGPAGALGASDIAAAVALNVTAPFMLTNDWLAASASVPDKRVLHISSGAGRNTYPGWSIYGATKAALDHHARAVQLDAVAGLRIESLAPGVVDTGMQTHIRTMSPERFLLVDRFLSLKATGQLTSAQDAAKALWAHLVSNQFGVEPVTDLRTLLPVQG